MFSLIRSLGIQFRRFKYFDIEVIQDVETGWINAGKFIKEISGLTKKDIKMKDFKRTEDFQFCLEYMRTIQDSSRDVLTSR